ncbi:ABC transporter ATP-binding protein [Paraburkholderia bannensis]|uniref:Branched-chain amino acid transport system ATP-binding protein/urea transport system ATP-binding protein n=1 Tax=Paraburkholderia tropica TaxID=92647 RepID=A0AAQ1GD68_9BURK|nr:MULTISPECIES: ATP-binding cassette domain-containing protein [Paraburkholderia]RQM50977.1 ABC transporter ATP-binding protein [Paraburkholderia bannensis]RQN40292.1 ABC transporter ATP-binding protein [Paraburkholderia tropica]SEJ32912.1 branched-chain amino acid transport system ATP-binding protein/urea transport system ATP-binding protein [Paraburkholderia tropica]
MTPLIETRNLNVRFGGVHATRDVNFKLDERELRCVIGPNGAGKSTFFKLLTGQVKPTSGEILFRGQDIAGMQPHEPGRLGIGIKTQVPSLFNGLTVWENVWIAARRKHAPLQTERVTAEVLERVGMLKFRDAIVGLLAHGQRQWVELGVVIAGDPPLILLDEPAAGMSDAEVERTAELILEINRNHALVVVEHDMGFIRKIAKKVTVLHQGAVVREDTPENIMSDPFIQQIYLGKKPQ